MITPNRYHLWAALECHAFSKAEAVLRFSAEEDGMWVQWQDYARLKAEVDNSNRINTELLLLSNKQASEVRRLTAELSNISGWGRGLESDLSHARVEISFLKAEVERLRKAGDAMAKRLYILENPTHPEVYLKLLSAWNAAKEGKQP